MNFRSQEEKKNQERKKGNVQNVETDVKVGILVVYCCRLLLEEEELVEGVGEEKRGFSKSKSLLRTK